MMGMADSNALVVATSAQQAVEFVGLPEANLILAHATVYIATAPKSNCCTIAIGKASAEVREGPHSCRSQNICATGTTRDRRNSGTARGTQIQPRLRRRIRPAGLSARRDGSITSPRKTGSKNV